MENQEAPKFVRGGPACALCGQALSDNHAAAMIMVPSRLHGQRYFGAHAECLRNAMRPEIAQFMDLADIPPGLGHIRAAAAG
jgi:hypothetical protein